MVNIKRKGQRIKECNKLELSWAKLRLTHFTNSFLLNLPTGTELGNKITQFESPRCTFFAANLCMIHMQYWIVSTSLNYLENPTRFPQQIEYKLLGFYQAWESNLQYFIWPSKECISSSIIQGVPQNCFVNFPLITNPCSLTNHK